MKINPTQLKIDQLLGSDNEQYVIPSYQRRYSWKQSQLDYLWEDIDMLGETESHLLGTIVCLSEAHNAQLNRIELVDGQQRLTTISILLHCILSKLKAENQTKAALKLESRLYAEDRNGGVVPKIQLDSLDADQYERHARGETVEEPENRSLAFAFNYFTELLAERSVEEIVDFQKKLLGQAIIVRLDVSEAKDAFKLFETINARGLRLSPTDNIKNYVLGNAARFGGDELRMAKDQWASLIKHLDGIVSENFFRHYLVLQHKARVTKSTLVEDFKQAFRSSVKEAENLPENKYYQSETASDEDSEELIANQSAEEDFKFDSEHDENEDWVIVSFRDFLDDMVYHAKCFREICLAKTGKPKLDRRLRNLRLIKAVPSYGFLTKLRAGDCPEKDFEEILRLTEILLMRRHICRERTNENEDLFVDLSTVDPKNPLPRVRESFKELCPSDDKFIEEFATTKFTGGQLDRARYCLEQLELHSQGEHTEFTIKGAEEVHIEHIIPQKIKSRQKKAQQGDWPAYLDLKNDAQHARFLARIGNLTLFAGELNISASNNPYHRKKTAYLNSAISLTKQLAAEYSEFRFSEVEIRSRALAAQAVKLWPSI